MKCMSCGKESHEVVKFPCPQCGKEIVRCLNCKKVSADYTCECGFSGP